MSYATCTVKTVQRSEDPLLPSVALGKDPLLPSVALGKDPVCRVLLFYRVFCPRHSAKYLFAEFRYFAEYFLLGTRQRYYCRVPDIMHSAKSLTLGKEENPRSEKKSLETTACQMTLVEKQASVQPHKSRSCRNRD